MSSLPLIAIVGPTASGKTGVAIQLAEKYGGEIICADSRTIYKYMDIGTAKPTADEQARVPHWGLDLVEPGERFTAYDFQQYAVKKITEIRARGHIPLLVGGTGLYVDAVVLEYQFRDDVENTFRKNLEQLSLEELHEYCHDNNINLPENSKNKRYVIRAIETGGSSNGRLLHPRSDTIVVGITTYRDILRDRISQRAEHLFSSGVVEEATYLAERYGWSSEAMTGNIYRVVRSYVEGDLTINEAVNRFTTLDWQLAKRQLTWLRRNDFIVWKRLDEVAGYIDQELESYH
jgi:tRNA dimethylallyltransferase